MPSASWMKPACRSGLPSRAATSSRPAATFSTVMSMSWVRCPSDSDGWISLVSASTRNACSTWPSRENSVLAREQSPQNTPWRCRSTNSVAIASNRRVRCLGASGGSLMNIRRYCQDPTRYRVTRSAVSKSGWITTPAGRTALRPISSRRPSTPYSRAAMRGGNSLSAHNCPSASTNLTRCRLGPTAISRSATCGAAQSRSGRSQGSTSSPGQVARSRNSGAAI